MDKKKTHQDENNQLLNAFLERTFYKGWRDPKDPTCENFRGLEFFFNTKCNLACKYCYISRFGDELYDPKIQGKKNLLKNLGMMLDWLIETEMVPDNMEYFSGEALVQEVGLQGLELMVEKLKKAKRKPSIVTIPTNFTFLLDEDITRRVKKILKKARSSGVNVGLSASFDGKYCEQNRPFRAQKEIRDDVYYDKVFSFTKEWGGGFHPMIYSDLIEKWPQNWLWFQENFKKYDLPWFAIYLLEVRNVEWTKEQMLKLGEFMDFLVEWSFNMCNKNVGDFINFILSGGFNILRNPLTTTGRGLGCSIQSAMTLRVGDLAWVNCHRSSYPTYTLAQFKTDGSKITGIEAKNTELLVGMYSHNAKNQPWCSECLLQLLCSHGCLGSQFETTGDLFTPIPTVCEMEHVKVMSILRAYDRVGVLETLLNTIGDDRSWAIRELMKMVDENSFKGRKNNNL